MSCTRVDFAVESACPLTVSAPTEQVVKVHDGKGVAMSTSERELLTAAQPVHKMKRTLGPVALMFTAIEAEE